MCGWEHPKKIVGRLMSLVLQGSLPREEGILLFYLLATGVYLVLMVLLRSSGGKCQRHGRVWNGWSFIILVYSRCERNMLNCLAYSEGGEEHLKLSEECLLWQKKLNFLTKEWTYVQLQEECS